MPDGGGKGLWEPGGGGALKASGTVWMLISPGGQGGSRSLGQGLGHEDTVKCKLGSKA